jgi:hypothetical protein
MKERNSAGTKISKFVLKYLIYLTHEMQAARTRTVEAGNSINETGEREGCAGDCVRRINDPEKFKHS